MGNTCVHIGSNCVEPQPSKEDFCQPVFKSPWVQPTDLIMANTQNQHQTSSDEEQCDSRKEAESLSQLPNKPPEQMIITKEVVQVQKQEISLEQAEKRQEDTVNPAAVLEKPEKVTRVLSAGLQVESVLKTKTGLLKEYYNLGPELGHGQYGTTFLCIEKTTGKEYACKSIAKRKLVDEEDLEDVRREIEIMHHLSGQPNVILIKGTYEDSVAVHVVMELCKGGELFDRIVAKGWYEERKAAMLARVIVSVVKNCHSLGVMHRDLKPENFLLVDEIEDSPIKAIDFGLSVFFKPGDQFEDVVGSPYYVAPEVLQNNYGPEADIWSAGVMIYCLLCGDPPFLGETEDEIFEEVQHGDVDFTSDPWPEISESAKDLIRKMLERDPKRRLTADQILGHPWIRDEESTPDKSLDSNS